MTILRVGGQPVFINGAPLTHPYLFHDDFTGDDDRLPPGWVDGHSFDETFAPLGIRSNALACIDPTNHDNEGEQSEGYPWDGIGCIWRETGVTDIAVTIEVTALRQNWREATPLLHVTPGTPTHGVGAWLSSFGPNETSLPAAGVVFVSYIGNPVTEFGLPAIAIGFFTRSNDSALFTIRSQGGFVTCHYNGEQIALMQNFGSGFESIDAFEVEEELVDSTMHGVAIDCHFDDDKEEPMVNDVWMASL